MMRNTVLMKLFYISLVVTICMFSCESNESSVEDVTKADPAPPTESTSKHINVGEFTLPAEVSDNPAAPNFNTKGSDAKAIRIADSIMYYHGGRQAWDDTRFLTWDFFGRRTLYWDKLKNRVRIEVPLENKVYLLDFCDPDHLKGMFRKLGNLVTDSLALAEELDNAYSIWINDSYWLVQPFKLKDDGVTLRYAGEARVDPQANRPSYKIDVTFDGVGKTPSNRYRLYVDKTNYHINTWEFYRSAKDAEPAIQTPWQGYRPYGRLMLSSDRGGKYQLKKISVTDHMQERKFTDF